MVSTHSPDVAVVDLRMPEGDGVWATSEIRAKAPALCAPVPVDMC